MRKLFTTIMTIFLVFVIYLFIKELLLIGASLDRLNEQFDVAFYVLIGLVLIWSLGRPLIDYLRQPPVVLLESYARGERESTVKLAKRVLKHSGPSDPLRKTLDDAIRAGELEPMRQAVEAYYAKRFDEIETLIKEKGKACFTYVALSQNGVLDTLLILGINLDLLAKIYRHLRLRQSPGDFLAFYRNVLTGAAVTGLYEEFDEELIEFVENQTEQSITKIPFAQVFVSSLLQGYGNAYLTHFLGYVTLNTYRHMIMGSPGSDDIRKQSRRDARKAVNALIKSPVDYLGRYLHKKGGKWKDKTLGFAFSKRSETEGKDSR